MDKTKTYPLASFSFNVKFSGANLNTEVGFQSVTGLTAEMQTEAIKEGGENRFEHTVPTRAKYTPLVLKRGLVKDSKLVKWCADAILNFEIEPINLQVQLLNIGTKQSLMAWDVISAWPKKWSVSDLDAEKSAIAIESLELSYQFFRLK